jgi:hypothetical protein
MATQDPYAAQLQQAYQLIQQGEREQALAILYGVVTGAPLHRDAWWLIAQAATNTRQREQALRRALEIDPTFEPARRLLDRLSQMNVPTEPGGTARPPEVPPAGPLPYAPPPPASDYGRPFEQARSPFEAEPTLPPPRPPRRERSPERERPPDRERPPEREREVVYVERGHLQPFLVVNGGCSSGCFSLVLTVIVVAVLAFLLLGDSISRGLQDTGGLPPGQSVPVSMVPAIGVTAVLALLRANPALLPINLGILGATGTGAEVFANAMRSFWQSQGYNPATGDAILGRVSGVGSQLGTFNWLIPVIFLGGWIVLAFFFVFLRARSQRLLHWGLSTVGLWVLSGLACGLGLLLYRLVGGGG